MGDHFTNVDIIINIKGNINSNKVDILRSEV